MSGWMVVLLVPLGWFERRSGLSQWSGLEMTRFASMQQPESLQYSSKIFQGRSAHPATASRAGKNHNNKTQMTLRDSGQESEGSQP